MIIIIMLNIIIRLILKKEGKIKENPKKMLMPLNQ